MESHSHSSQEKLMRLEEGLIHPQIPFVTEPRKWSSKGCTKQLLVYLATVLLIVTGYQIWQAVRTDHLVQKIEDGQRILSLAPESSSDQDVVEELERMRFALAEIKEHMDRRSQVTPETTEFPITTTIESMTDETTEDWEREWLSSVLAESNNNNAKLPSPDSPITSTSEAPEVMVIDQVIDEGIIKVPESWEGFESVLDKGELEETESGWIWKVYFNFGQGSADEKGTSEERDAIEVKGTEGATPTEAEKATSDEDAEGYMHSIFIRPFTDMGWRFGLDSPDREDYNVSANEEQAKADVVEIETPKATEPIVVDYRPEIYEDYYNYYGDYDSSEDYTPSKLGDYGNSKTEENEESTLTEFGLEDTITEYSSAPTSNKDKPEVIEAEIIETTVSTPPKTHGFSSDTTKSSGRGDGDSTESTIPEKTVENLPRQDDSLSERDSEMPEGIEKNYWFDVFFGDGEDNYYGDESDDWSYISKRSIDTASREGSRRLISPKQLTRKLAIIQQAIDDENHILQNEVSMASDSTKSILQQKLQNFYAKMEAVSAHIDRLHQRYLKANGLDDDYVSREFPTDQDTRTSNN